MKHQFRNTSLVLLVDGDILSTTAESLRAGFLEVINSDAAKRTAWDRLEIDLSRAKVIDSAGLNLVVGIVKTVKARGCAVIARMTSRTIHRTFVFTRLDKQVEVVLEGAA
jgi:anti-anti-sigma factor